jgi:colanic acid/amylovoran biosynthesis glycosyltransferase
MLNCLHLLNTYLGISETFIWNYLNSYRRFKPLIIAAKTDNLEHFPLTAGRLLPCSPVKRRLADLMAHLKRSYAQVNYRACYPELEKQPIDIAHAHYGYRAMVSLHLIEKLNCPLVTSFYGYDLSRRGYLKRAIKGYKELFKKGDAFLVEGPCMREKLARLGCPWDKIHIQRISIHPKKYAYHTRIWDGNRPVKFLFIGRLVEKKGLLVALRAFTEMRAMFDWQFTIIGDGPLRGLAERYIREQRLENRVRLTGFVTHEVMLDHLSSHDILIQPSHKGSDGDSEGGAPTVLLEAQASGMPILSTLHDDIPNVVGEGINAYLSEETDVNGLTGYILRMVENHAQWPKMAEAGLKNVLNNHDVEKEVNALEKKYFSLLS